MTDKSPPPPRADDPVSPIDEHDYTDQAADGYAESVRSFSSRGDPFADPTPSEHVDSEPQSPSSGASLSSDETLPSSPAEPSALPRIGARDPLWISRTTSTRSAVSDVPPQSPTQSEHGPSHPYGMYPQDLAISRSASVATASTIRAPNRTLNTSQTPSHAYGSYPQNLQLETMQSSSQAAYPIGFPGHHQRFHRRIGPEGEEQDIIGADGHLEQLPPYSRYPQEHDNKSSGIGNLPVIGESSATSAQSPGSTGESQDQTIAPPSSGFSSDGDTLAQPNNSNLHLTESEVGISEKRWRQKTWKERARLRVCGAVPLWILTLIVVVIVIICIVCGTVISIFIYNHRSGAHYQPPAAESSPITPSSMTLSYVDATPIPTPPNLPNLPIGTYTVPFGGPSDYGAQCLNNTNEALAWTCRFPVKDVFTIQILTVNNTPVLTSSYLGPQLQNGQQPPTLTDMPLSLVDDLEDPTLGCAFHFQTVYDKLVILPSSVLTATVPLPTYHQPQTPQGPKDTDAHPAWFCYWNNTFIEGFIYINDPAVKTASFSGTGEFPAGPTDWSSMTSMAPSAASTTSAQSAALVSKSVNLYSTMSSSTIMNAPPTPSSQLPLSASSYAGDKRMPSNPQPGGTGTFPNRLKFMERRLAGQHPQPYCELMQIDWLGTWTPMPMVPGGPPITIQLNEMDPNITYQLKRSAYGFGGQSLEPRDRRERRSSTDNDLGQKGCYCQWMV